MTDLVAEITRATGDMCAVADDITVSTATAHLAADDSPLDVALALLAWIAKQRADLALIAQQLEAATVAEMPYRYVVEGLGEFVRHGGKKRSAWENEALTAHVLARALDERILDEDTGEYESEGQAVARVLSECMRPNWRLTPLRARGIQVDEFCHEEQGAPTIELPKRKVGYSP